MDSVSEAADGGVITADLHAGDRSAAWRPRVWGPPVAAALLYPGLIYLFGPVIATWHAFGRPSAALGGLLLMLLATGVPIIAARALYLVRAAPGHSLAKGLLCLMVATPSFFTFTVTLTRLAGLYPWLGEIWIMTWVAVAALLYFQSKTSVGPERARDVAVFRIVHGGAAALLLCGFVFLHLFNHVAALGSLELQRDVMSALRTWYRSSLIEPILLLLVGIMILTGVRMLGHYLARPMDKYRVVQVMTGAYLAVFLTSHVFATLNARRLGIETDWSFAAGANFTLIGGVGLEARLVPHYFMSVVAVIVHAGAGLRIVVLQHGWAVERADKLFHYTAMIAVAVGAAILAGLMGVHIA